MKRIIPRKLIFFRRSLKPWFRKVTGRNTQHKDLIPVLHIHLTDHCNLNCKGCDNFSPISPEVFASVDVFEKDCAQLSALGGECMEEIQLLGGEPLLHPQVTEFMKVARKYFPTVPITIVSNGLLLLKQPDEFWENCRHNKIRIVVTKYPVKLDFDAIENHVISQGVPFSFYGNTREIPKNMECVPLDLTGKQNPRDSFLRCARANRCVALDNGKIYTCSLIPYIKYFNAQFNKNLEVTSADYMDIHTVKNMNEILDFLCKPMPFCRYCNIKGTIYDVGYGVSKKDITEWIGK